MLKKSETFEKSEKSKTFEEECVLCYEKCNEYNGLKCYICNNCHRN